MALALALAVGPAWAEDGPGKYALLIGLNRYAQPLTVPQLRWAEKDVRDLATVLEKQGYEVTSLVNRDAQRDDIVSELARHAALARQHEAEAFLVFFAGHGVRNLNGRTYWLSYDADLDLLDVKGIRLDHMLDFVADVKAKRKLVLLDHCFSGDLVQSTLEAGGVPRGPAPGAPATEAAPRDAPAPLTLQARNADLVDLRGQLNRQAQGTALLAGARHAALEVQGLEHGIFTAALLKALTSRDADTTRDAKLSVLELQAYLRAKVPQLARDEAHGEQEVLEFLQGSIDGWFVAENLPISGPDEARQKAEAFKRKLLDWYEKGWVSDHVKTTCWDILVSWVENVEQGRDQLADATRQRVLGRMRETLDRIDRERARADELKVFVEQLIPPPPDPA